MHKQAFAKRTGLQVSSIHSNHKDHSLKARAIERTIEPIAHLSLYQLVYLCNSIATSFNEPIHSSAFAPSLPKVNNQRKQVNPRYSRLNLSLQFNTQGCSLKIKVSALSHCRPNHASLQSEPEPIPSGTRRHQKRQETDQSDKQVKCFNHFSGARGTQKQDLRPKLLCFRPVSSETVRKNRFLNSSNHPPPRRQSDPRPPALSPGPAPRPRPPRPPRGPGPGGRPDPWPSRPPSAGHGRPASGAAGR